MAEVAKHQWTKEEVTEIVTVLAYKRYGIAFDSYIQKLKENEVDRCKDSDIIGLLKLIGICTESVAA